MLNILRSAIKDLYGIGIAVGLTLLLITGHFNMSSICIFLAIAAFLRVLAATKAQEFLKYLYQSFWIFMVGLFFTDNQWSWFLIGSVIFIIFKRVFEPLIMGNPANRQQQVVPPSYIQQSQQPYYTPPPQNRTYAQGYQPIPSVPEYTQIPERPAEEPFDQYEQPQTHYPQSLPPQQQS